MSASGGTLTPLTRVDKSRGELSHQLPRVLADGKTVLFAIWVGDVRESELAATSLDDGKVTPLGIAGVIPLGVIDGALTYLSADGVIMAVPFDVKKRSRAPLFEGRYEEDFDVAPDGERFLMIQPEATGIGLVVIPSWRSELRRVRAADKR